MDGKPEIRTDWKCRHCGKEAVALELPNYSANVTWCSDGHVTVFCNQTMYMSKVVFDFKIKEVE